MSAPSAVAQRLILAQDATLTTTVNAKALFTQTGSLIVQKTITGPAAGQQGAVTINVRCGGALVGDPFDIPAGSTGTQSMTYDNIPVGTKCTVTEIHDGHTSTVTVEVDGSGETVTVGAGTKTATITDTYSFVTPGVLVVKKSITGPGAGQQGEVVIQPTCDGTGLPPFTIAAGATGQPTQTYLVAPGSVCTLTETVDDHTGTVTVTVDGSGQQVTVPGGSSVQAVLTDTYDLAPGSLTVTKTIVGPAAGQQGDVTIGVTCNENGVDTPLPDFTIAAGAAAGSTSRTYTGIPAGSVCTATETATGDTSTVTTTVTGDNGTPTSIPAGATGTANITDTYSLTPGALIVKKTITGPGAGLQGEITIQPTCGGTVLPALVIPAGTPAGFRSQLYPTLAAGTVCTITETGDGANSAVSVVVAGDDQVTVPPGGIVTAERTDTYTPNPGSLVVNKTITGAGAGQQGPITITVTCNANGVDTPLPDFTVPAGTTTPPTQSHTYAGIPGGSLCTATETATGDTSTVTTTVTGDNGTPISIPAGGTGTAAITDTYALTPGALI